MQNLEKNISDIRNEYKLKHLSENEAPIDPFELFKVWLNEALKSNLYEPTAMTLATVSHEGKPSSRVLLLKGFDNNGFVFFTNYNSKKGQEIEKNPYAAMNFFWPEIERQVRIEGKITKVSPEESEEYFNSRPFESRIGAIISSQSSTIDLQELESRKKEAFEKYSNIQPERPLHWGGYCLTPDYLEFWQGRPGRLHDRLVYQKSDNNEWTLTRIAP